MSRSLNSEAAICAIMSLTLSSLCGCLARDNWGGLSSSADEARRIGTLVCKLDVSPSEFVLQGKRVKIREAWLENSYDVHFWCLIPYRVEKNDICHLNYSFDEGGKLTEHRFLDGCESRGSCTHIPCVPSDPEDGTVYTADVTNRERNSWEAIFRISDNREDEVAVSFSRPNVGRIHDPLHRKSSPLISWFSSR